MNLWYLLRMLLLVVLLPHDNQRPKTTTAAVGDRLPAAPPQCNRNKRLWKRLGFRLVFKYFPNVNIFIILCKQPLHNAAAPPQCNSNNQRIFEI
jgi:hypothetical protein